MAGHSLCQSGPPAQNTTGLSTVCMRKILPVTGVRPFKSVSLCARSCTESIQTCRPETACLCSLQSEEDAWETQACAQLYHSSATPLQWVLPSCTVSTSASHATLCSEDEWAWHSLKADVSIPVDWLMLQYVAMVPTGICDICQASLGSRRCCIA